MTMIWTKTQSNALRDLESELRCPLCENIFQEPYSTHCEHHFCKICIDDALFKRSICPTCNAPTIPKDLQRNATYCNIVDSFLYLKRYLEDLKPDIIDDENKDENDLDDDQMMDTGEGNISEDSESNQSNQSMEVEGNHEGDTSHNVPEKRNTDSPNSRDSRSSSSIIPGTQEMIASAKKAEALMNQVLPFGDVVALCSGVHKSDFPQVQSMVQSLGGKCEDILPEDFASIQYTHLLVEPQETNSDGSHVVKMSLKYFYAISKGLKVLHVSWVRACAQAHKVVDEIPHQIRSRKNQEQRCRDAIINRLNPGLFQPYNFILMFADGNDVAELHDYRVYQEITLSMLQTMTGFNKQVRDMSYIMKSEDVDDAFDIEDVARVSDLEPFDNGKQILLIEYHRAPSTETHDKKSCPRCIRYKAIANYFASIHENVIPVHYSFVFQAFLDQQLPDVNRYSARRKKK